MIRNALSTMLAASTLASGLHAQVVINEVQENPPGSTDEFYEYMELYGRPGMSLDGMAIALLKGGTIEVVEIDEAFSLDGLSLGSNGLLVLVNDTGGGTLLPPFPPETTVATFTQTHIPTVDTPGKLGNDDSSTYVLIRARPVTGGQYGTDWRKDVAHDVDLNGTIDYPIVPLAAILEPYQMIDDIAWSNNAGFEYTRDSLDEINETVGYNPDAISRLRYYANAGPGPGLRAEEEWVRGDILDLVTFPYVAAEFAGPTGLDLTGARLTPGSFNDFGAVAQFRFVVGDLNFDGSVSQSDLTIAQSLLGATLDDREDCLDGNGDPIIDPNTGDPYQCYVYQGRAFNVLEALRSMDPTDGPGGENADEATQSDIDALEALVGCPADIDGDGDADGDDFFGYLDLFAGGAAAADLDGDGDRDADDFFMYLDLFAQGC
ncbi:MAG: hypothetical protein H6811_08770 [Phycisphaeraceae bacterium]|nr:hypothetical protein [Phycisphaeraceae bacterium]